MGNSGGILRYGLEGHTKCVFPITIADVNMAGSGGGMIKLIKERMQFFQFDDASDDISGYVITWSQAFIVLIYCFTHLFILFQHGLWPSSPS
jgi:hypothetical protein